MIDFLIDFASLIKSTLERKRLDRRWTKLRQRGMGLGADVWLPASTWIDPDYCFLISIEAHCGFGEECLILAHDAQMDEFLDAARIGSVRIRESCHIGARSVILPGVEVGPRTIVGAGSVISRSLPPNSVCAGILPASSVPLRNIWRSTARGFRLDLCFPVSPRSRREKSDKG